MQYTEILDIRGILKGDFIRILPCAREDFTKSCQVPDYATLPQNKRLYLYKKYIVGCCKF